MEQTEKFETWGIVEVMGHKKFAGRIGEQIIAGCAFVRVDVPETQQRKDVSGYGGSVVEVKPGYTKHVGTGSIYCITPTDEDTARRAAAVIERYNDPLPVTLPKLLPAGATAAPADEEAADAEWTTGWDGDDEDDDEEEPRG